MSRFILVFIHGYSVTNLDSYGGLPARLVNEGLNRKLDIAVENIFLGQYISFNDAIRLSDLARALNLAVEQQLQKMTINRNYVFITHSTGAAIVRTWLDIYYKGREISCPLRHLIMLAPANFGSALAQLGKERLSRIKAWFDGVEPGQQVLNWLEHGSADAMELNTDWIKNGNQYIEHLGIFLFVITGQDIDRKLYDHLNSYTGEDGSDGVIRVAAANLNARYVQLTQNISTTPQSNFSILEIKEVDTSPPTAFRVIKNKSHSGKEMGIMRSVKATQDDLQSRELIDVIFECIQTTDKAEYQNLIEAYRKETFEVQQQLRVEPNNKGLFSRPVIHDKHVLVIFRIKDNFGFPVNDFDLLLTAGEQSNPDGLPDGFFTDRQINRLANNTLSYYLNYDMLAGCPEVPGPDGKIIRPALKGINKIGLIINPRPLKGFIRYQSCEIKASQELFDVLLRPNSCTIVEITLQRIISDKMMSLQPFTGEEITNKEFKNISSGNKFV
jgi:hypothetical protein